LKTLCEAKTFQISGRACSGATSAVSTMLGTMALTRTPKGADFGCKAPHQLDDAGLGRPIYREARLDCAHRGACDEAATILPRHHAAEGAQKKNVARKFRPATRSYSSSV
jgi:hypothetical protein